MADVEQVQIDTSKLNAMYVHVTEPEAKDTHAVTPYKIPISPLLPKHHQQLARGH